MKGTGNWFNELLIELNRIIIKLRFSKVEKSVPGIESKCIFQEVYKTHFWIGRHQHKLTRVIPVDNETQIHFQEEWPLTLNTI